MDKLSIIEADLTWVDNAFEPNVQVAVSSTGFIEQVGYLDHLPSLRLEGQALMPGMINAHSRTFQRGMRGFAEEYARGRSEADTWQQAVLELAGMLSLEEFQNFSRVAFQEMLRSGITTVGEFHYLHHEGPAGDYAFDEALREVAAQVGIRLVLICVYCPPRSAAGPSAWVRFQSASRAEFCDQVDHLLKRVQGPTQQVGIGVWGLDTTPLDDVLALAGFAAERRLILHVPLDASRDELQACRAAYGAPAAKLLLERGLFSPGVSGIHCTHTSAEVLRKMAEQGSGVCLCPSTEANLGCGIPDVATIRKSGMPLALGTGSNVRISLPEEMRWLEYVQRLQREKRGVCVDERGRSAAALWQAATTDGARVLGLTSGHIAPGCPADFFTIDTRGLSLLGATRESLLAAFVFGTGRSCVTRTCVGGCWHDWDA